MATIDEFLISLRAEFGEQASGKKFEVFCKWFLENDPEWSKKVDKVWLWDDYPNKWQRQDLGTDLVFQDREGLIWAVQTKCYSPHLGPGCSSFAVIRSAERFAFRTAFRTAFPKSHRIKVLIRNKLI